MRMIPRERGARGWACARSFASSHDARGRGVAISGDRMELRAVSTPR